jgi:Bardet-Biedl syndrome 9 protein
MSLFKAREYWSCQVGSGEQFDHGCLKVGSFNEDSNNKIVVGSHSGIIRIYNPSSSEPDSITNNHATDLLLEKNLGMPIVQIDIGKFISTQSINQVAILFSHKLSVYDYIEQSGVTEHGRQIDLELNYEHNFNRPTFNMCKGQFGRGNKDSGNDEYICVQTLDGVLFVFEYERQSMVKSLPNTYLPGPLCYLSRLDAFLTVSSNYHLECYKYQALAVSSGVDHGTNNKNDVRRKGVDSDTLSVSQSSKRVLPEWSFNLGECALEIQTTQRIRNTPQTILVLGERNLFSLNDNGQLIFMSKFEYSPSSLIVYNNEIKTDGQSDSTVRYIIGTHSHTLFIVQDAHIRWAAYIDSTPIQIDVCTIQ